MDFDESELRHALATVGGIEGCSPFLLAREASMEIHSRDAGGLTLTEAARALIRLDALYTEAGRATNEARRAAIARHEARYPEIRDGRLPGGLAQLHEESAEMFREVERQYAALVERRLEEAFRELLPPDRFAVWAQSRARRLREIEAQGAEERARLDEAKAAATAKAAVK